MERILLSLSAAIILAGCNKQQAVDDEDLKPASAPARTATPSSSPKSATATPLPRDWMWKTSKGTPRENDPLKVKDSRLDSTPKK